MFVIDIRIMHITHYFFLGNFSTYHILIYGIHEHTTGSYNPIEYNLSFWKHDFLHLGFVTECSSYLN